MRGHRDLIIAALAAVLFALVCVLVPWQPLQIVAAVPLTLILPGWAIVAAAFAGHDLSAERRGLLTLGSSLAVLALGTLVLNFVPGGITDWSWALLLAVFVVAACFAAAWRRPAPQPRVVAARPRPAWRDLAMLGVGVFLAAAAIVSAQQALPAKEAKGFSALWMLPTPKKEPKGVRVGVISAEQHRVGFRLVVSGPQGGRLLEKRMSMPPGQRRSFDVPVVLSSERSIAVSAELYRFNDPDRVYRKVKTWLPPISGT